MWVDKYVDDIELSTVTNTHDAVQRGDAWRWQHCAQVFLTAASHQTHTGNIF